MTTRTVIADLRGVLSESRLVVAGSRLAQAAAPWRWRLTLVAVVVEALLARNDAPLDLPMFSARGSDLLRGHLAAVYSQSYNQAGPLQLVIARLLVIGGGPDSVPVWTKAACNIGLLVLVRLACRSRFTTIRPRSAAREAIAGVLLVAWLVPNGLWAGHPVEILIPICWVFACVCAYCGHGVRAGVLLGLATAITPWGILALPVVLLAPSRWTAISGAATGILIGVGAYLPFILSGHFQLLHFHWPLTPDSLIALIAPGTHTFTWTWRILQATIAMSACAAIAVRRHNTDAIWLAPLASTLVRIVTDPMFGDYYWQPFAALTIAAIAFGAPSNRSHRSWLAIAALTYLPLLANADHRLWIIVGTGCAAAVAVLAIETGQTAAITDAAPKTIR